MLSSQSAFFLLRQSFIAGNAMPEVMLQAQQELLPIIYPILGRDALVLEFSQYKVVQDFLADPKSESIDALLNELTTFYTTKVGKPHRIKPGIQVSALDLTTFYAGVHAFPNGVDSRIVVATAKGISAMDAMNNAMTNWRGVIEQALAQGVLEGA